MKKLLCLSALIVYVFACCPSSATKPTTPIAKTVTAQPSTETSLPTDTPTPSPPLAKVTASTLNVRTGPGTDYTIVGKLSLDDSVEVVGKNAAGDWLQVVYPANSDRRGWIAADYAKLTAPLETVPEVSAPTLAPPTATPKPEHDEMDARMMCAEFVRERLVAPSTAKFDYSTESAVHLGGGRYKVTGAVDAQNRFGVMIRMWYGCELRYGGNDIWYLDDIKIWE